MQITDLEKSHENIYRAFRKSNKKLEELKEKTPEKHGCSIITNGSLARLEITQGSDFDAYTLYDEDKTDEKKAKDYYNSTYKKSGLCPPSIEGPFSKPISMQSMIKNIGGQIDDNNKLTQRSLFILESKCLSGDNLYDEILNQIIERYIGDKITNHQIGMFLLNDIIRFYRTMCIDFEYKTVEKNKSWGIRNIKLMYSRKLMYFSGIIMCAELAQRTAKEKRKKLNELISKTPIERLLSVMGNGILPALSEYDKFLDSMDNTAIREKLENVTKDNQNELFRDLKNSGHHFTWKLSNSLKLHYDSTHPIHRAIIM